MNHSFNIDFATEYGINCAIIMDNLYFWIVKNIANNKNCFDGKTWTYNSVSAFQKLFPYMGKKQIQNAIKKLEDEGLIECGNYNKNSYDRTKWYAITEKGMAKLQKAGFHFPKDETPFAERGNGNGQKDEPIPDNKPSSTPDPKKERKKATAYDDILDAHGISGNLREAFIEYIKMRKLIKAPLTDRALELAIKDAMKYGRTEEEQIAVLEQSIQRSWKGLFPLKEDKSKVKQIIEDTELGASERRVFDQWEKVLGYRPEINNKNAAAAKRLLELDGEQGVNTLISTLRMRSRYGYLTREITSVDSPETLLNNREAIWSFFKSHEDTWRYEYEQAKQGKKPWEI